MDKKARLTTVDEYIAQCPPEVRPILERLRAEIGKAAPKAVERISYQMPGFYLNGNLVWFGLHTHHIGFYPTGEGIETFKEELAPYKKSKGAVQFPLDKPIPYPLIRRIVKHRVAEKTRQSGLTKPPTRARRSGY